MLHHVHIGGERFQFFPSLSFILVGILDKFERLDRIFHFLYPLMGLPLMTGSFYVKVELCLITFFLPKGLIRCKGSIKAEDTRICLSPTYRLPRHSERCRVPQTNPNTVILNPQPNHASCGPPGPEGPRKGSQVGGAEPPPVGSLTEP